MTRADLQTRTSSNDDHTLADPRSSLRMSQGLDVLNIVLALPCLGWTGSFIWQHLAEPRFWAPAVVLHAWLVGSVAIAVARFARAAMVRYDVPLAEIARQLEAIRVFALRSLRVLFVTGVLVFGAPLAIVAARAWLGVDLYARDGGWLVLVLLAAGAAIALLTLAISALRPRRLSRLMRPLAGYNLAIAEDRLAALARTQGGA
jgi:hypothetical protein